MDDSGHRENGRHKPPQGQWLMQQQPSMKQIMGFMAERDAAIQERNLAISEKKTALAERDMAILQRDSAIAERNNAMMERDNAIATLQYRENAINSSSNNNNNNMAPCPPGCQIPRGVKHMHHPQQHQQQQQQHIHHHHHQSHMAESPYNNNNNNNSNNNNNNTRDTMQMSDTVPISPVAPEPTKTRRAKRLKEAKPAATAAPRKASKNSKRVKREEDNNLNDLNNLNKAVFGKSHDMELGGPKLDWKDQDLGLNQVAFDESTMPVPVCSCTGFLRPCYKWGNGGWQSSCCTTNLSMYPLPAVPNKRHARVGGRKMSGSAFNKLISRLAAEGHDLSNPVDLKDHWAKHGTNRYITIK